MYGMLYSIAVNWRTIVILFGRTFLDRYLFDHETVSTLLSSSGPGPGQVKVRCRSSEGQEGQSQV